MRIGYSVEGSADRAVLKGLQRRWCPAATLLEGRFRGTTGQSARREIPNVCVELCAKGAELIVFLRDANLEDWRAVVRAEESRCRPEHRHLAVFGVCNRNVECWIAADPAWLAEETGRSPDEFRVNDPKDAVCAALGVTGRERKEPEIAALVERAPLRNWLNNASFADFYDKLWQKSKERHCALESIREGPTPSGEEASALAAASLRPQTAPGQRFSGPERGPR